MMDKPKVFALYLPQYHAIPENDEWWGKGFTEWTNVKKAKPMFKGHNQPRVPLNENYYNLLDDSTFQWQISLAKKYGIDGFCFYHYWFNGKLLLEKPLENYLANPALDLPFFFSWANEPWTRSWDGRNRNILMNQVYGGETDIVNHFNYMLPFFKDPRYVKTGNKPLFVLYRANSITYLEEMVEIWNKLATENGFDGIFFIESLTIYQTEKLSDKTDACFHFEPMWSNMQNGLLNKLLKVKTKLLPPAKRSYKKSMTNIIEKERISDVRYAGFFVDWDNSPRKGKGSLVYSNTSAAVFETYLRKLFDKMKAHGCPYVFINAWNEWAEGAYLEPDTTREYAFLEAIKRVKESV